MEPTRTRAPIYVSSIGFFLLLALTPETSTPSVPDPLPPPDLEEVLALEELAGWLLGEERLEILDPAEWSDLERTVRERERSFELFRRYTDKESRRAFLRELPYGDAIFRTADEHRVDSLLVAAVVEVESNFHPLAESNKGALGLMQVLPSTAGLFGIADLGNPTANLEAGTRYLGSLLELYGGDLRLALAAYNAGPGNVARYRGIPPFRETRDYVEKVLAIYVDHHRHVWNETAPMELLALR